MQRFLNFQTMVMEFYIPAIFLVGLIPWFLVALASLITGLGVMATQGVLYGGFAILIGTGIALVGGFFWRLACEIAIVLFKIHSNLLAVREGCVDTARR